MAMTLEQFAALLKFIEKNHMFGLRGRHIKYVRPDWDMRQMGFFCVNFDCIGGRVKFAIVNHDAHRNLHDWIMSWLNGEIEMPAEDL
jgi:hypothetical protein